jgi:hypothetical protein
MGSMKKYIPLVVIILPVIIAVILRSTGTGHFRYDSEKWAEPSIHGKNLITPGKLSGLKGNIMVINFAGNRLSMPVYPNQSAISPDSVMTKNVMKMISRNRGPVVLWSDDPALSARIWMLMSQSGIKDLYILSLDTLNETLKEKFRTDTLIRPEL